MNAVAPLPLAAADLTVVRDGALVLDRVSFGVDPGCLMGVLGPNGAGKSTLFQALAGLLPIQAGSVCIHGQSLPRMRGRLAYVSQQQAVNWRVPVSVRDAVLQGRIRTHRWWRRPRAADRAAVEAALRQVDLWERRRDPMRALSVGQRQRAFLARSLAQGADIFLFDESLSGVDVRSKEALMSTFWHLRDQGQTILIASHVMAEVEHCDECLCLDKCVKACGRTQDILTKRVLHDLFGPYGAQSAPATRRTD